MCEYEYTPTRISLEKQKVRKAKEWQGEWKHAKQCDFKTSVVNRVEWKIKTIWIRDEIVVIYNINVD